jgi:hypothetical protein
MCILSIGIHCKLERDGLQAAVQPCRCGRRTGSWGGPWQDEASVLPPAPGWIRAFWPRFLRFSRRRAKRPPSPLSPLLSLAHQIFYDVDIFSASCLLLIKPLHCCLWSLPSLEMVQRQQWPRVLWPGDECCGSPGGYGWFGGSSGFGPGTYGYNYTLYWGGVRRRQRQGRLDASPMSCCLSWCLVFLQPCSLCWLRRWWCSLWFR